MLIIIDIASISTPGALKVRDKNCIVLFATIVSDSFHISTYSSNYVVKNNLCFNSFT